MKKENIYLVLGIILVVAIGFFAWKSNQRGKEKTEPQTVLQENSKETVFYYGNQCPHCHVVIKFLDDNKVADKVAFTRKEVSGSTENSNELYEKAKECGLAQNQIGVPFVYAKGKCYVGEIEVLDFFKKEAGLQ